MLLAAYDDPIGVTAAFNLNLLGRINRELDGHFDLSEFDHVARFDSTARRVEMHLRSNRRQRVAIEKADMSVIFEEGETIWTESSHKYTLARTFSVWLNRAASAAKRSGSTPSGPSPKTCGSPSSVCYWAAIPL